MPVSNKPVGRVTGLQYYAFIACNFYVAKLIYLAQVVRWITCWIFRL